MLLVGVQEAGADRCCHAPDLTPDRRGGPLLGRRRLLGRCSVAGLRDLEEKEKKKRRTGLDQVRRRLGFEEEMRERDCKREEEKERKVRVSTAPTSLSPWTKTGPPWPATPEALVPGDEDAVATRVRQPLAGDRMDMKRRFCPGPLAKLQCTTASLSSVDLTPRPRSHPHRQADPYRCRPTFHWDG
jgi:hypothetical protein